MEGGCHGKEQRHVEPSRTLGGGATVCRVGVMAKEGAGVAAARRRTPASAPRASRAAML